MQQCLGAALFVLTLTVWPMLEDRNIVYSVNSHLDLHFNSQYCGIIPAKQKCCVEHGV